MTYTIKFVNFTLGALFQNNLGRVWGCARSQRSMVATPMDSSKLTNTRTAINYLRTVQSERRTVDIPNDCIAAHEKRLAPITVVGPDFKQG